jgi:hypothetical protein
MYNHKISKEMIKMTVEPTIEITTELTDFFNEDAKWMELASSSINFSAPAFIGCMISDKDGKTIAIFEVFKSALEYFIKKDIKDIEKRNNFDIELIPMFICALERFSDQICIENLAGIKLKGTNIKMHSVFCFSQFTITLFLNPFIHIKPYENMICHYFSELFEKYSEELEDVLKFNSNVFISQIELKGRAWLRELNELFLNSA